MIIKYFYDTKLAQASYLIGSDNHAMVIDPARDITPYIQVAQDQGLNIEWIAETHIHADFVSGARELAFATGATILLSGMGGDEWAYHYPQDDKLELLHDGDSFMVGDVKVEVIHTPGHSPEHIAFQITDTKVTDLPMGIFTGDFLFVGDIGRPDLLETAAGQSDTALIGARQQFANVQHFKELPDYLHIWSGHGEGSVCGKSLGAIPSTTLGYEKRVNPAFQFDDEDEFVTWLLDNQPETPRYFGHMKKVNQAGAELLLKLPQAQHILERPDEFLPADAFFIDTRDSELFAKKHHPGTINIPIHSRNFATYVGWFVDYDKPTYFIAYLAEIQEVLYALFSIGIENIPAYFTPEVIRDESDSIIQLSPQDAYEKGYPILDVRSRTEYESEHIPGAIHIPMGYVLDKRNEIPDNEPIIVHCESGTRAQLVISLLKKTGYQNLLSLAGGFDAWKAADLPVEGN